MTGNGENLDLYLVHDYLIQMGGAERVVAAMASAYPDAPIHTSITEYRRLLETLRGRDIRNSALHRLPGSAGHFKELFPFYPLAFGCMKMPRSRAAWISTSMFAKCVRAHPETTTFCYMHSPPRFLYQGGEYLDGEIRSRLLRGAVRAMSPWLRAVDRKATARMDYLIANSRNIAERIEKIYGRKAEVIHPPVNVGNFSVSDRSDDSYLILSRLIGYKRVDLAIEAFRGLDRKLIVAGDGTDRKRIESLAGDNNNIEIRGWVSEKERMDLLANARGLIFPGCEDFGIAPVEAMACGKPVIAYNKGGATETVVDGRTGVLFDAQTPESLRDAILKSEGIAWDTAAIRRNAERFSEVAFLSRTKEFIQEKLEICPMKARRERMREDGERSKS